MASMELLIKAWDAAVWEYSLVFEGLEDGDLWKRPHPSLLSVGELTGHVAYYEAVMSTEPASNGDMSKVPIKSPLVDPTFQYYSTQIGTPVGLGLSVAETLAEFKRVHEEAKAAIAKTERNDTDLIQGRDGTTWGEYLQYLGFHAAYHAGQAYSVRHLLGHTTTDN